LVVIAVHCSLPSASSPVHVAASWCDPDARLASPIRSWRHGALHVGKRTGARGGAGASLPAGTLVCAVASPGAWRSGTSWCGRGALGGRRPTTRPGAPVNGRRSTLPVTAMCVDTSITYPWTLRHCAWAEAQRMLATGGGGLSRGSGPQPDRIGLTREAYSAQSALAAVERSMNPVDRSAPHNELPLEQLSNASDRNARAKATARSPHTWGSSPDACGGLLRSSLCTSPARSFSPGAAPVLAPSGRTWRAATSAAVDRVLNADVATNDPITCQRTAARACRQRCSRRPARRRPPAR
jgi:hypothetical protein